MTGCGKSSVGEKLARKIGYEFLDLDKIIVQREGAPIPEIFANYGEEYFRQCEYNALNEALLTNQNTKILSCGGGVILAPRNRELLRENSTVIWITRAAKLVLKNQAVLARPPINGEKSRYLDLLQLRQPMYQETAHFVVKNKKIAVCVREITQLLSLNE